MSESLKAVGNTTAAEGKASNPWDGLADMKMGAVLTTQENIENKKCSLASKWEAFRARKAEKKARKQFENVENEYLEGRQQQSRDSRDVHAVERSRNEANDAHTVAETLLGAKQEEYNVAKEKASTGEYAKNQLKQVANVLKAGGSVIRNGIKAFLSDHKKTTFDDAIKVFAEMKKPEASEGATAEKPADTFTAVAQEIGRRKQEARDAKTSSKEKFREALKGFGVNKAEYKNNTEAKKGAKEALNAAKADYKEKEERLLDFVKEHDRVSKEYAEQRDKMEEIGQKRREASEKLAAAQTRAREAEKNVKLAETVLELREQFGSNDPGILKAELTRQKDELIDSVNNKISEFRKRVGVEDGKPVPVELRPALAMVVEMAGQDKLEEVDAKLDVIEQYESVKKRQAEKVAKNKAVKGGLRAFGKKIFGKLFGGANAEEALQFASAKEKANDKAE